MFDPDTRVAALLDRGKGDRLPVTWGRLQVLTLDLPGLSHASQAEAACAGGARWIQFRSKTLTGDALTEEARAVVAVCRRHGAVCIVNDTPRLALAAGADGVHLGRTDMAPSEARKLLGSGKIIGVTVNSIEDARRVVGEGLADYAGVGPWRFTTSKANLSPVLSPENIGEILRMLTPTPCVVIGGVTPDDVPAILATGAHGVAVASGVVSADNPGAAVKTFLARL